MVQALQLNQDDALLREPDKATILMVDDDSLALSLLEEQVAELNLDHHVIRAGNGREALTKLARHKDTIDVVLMDREMPLMDGIAAVRRMKEDPALRNIPVIMITGADATDHIQEGLEAGVFYYLIKPADVKILHSVLSAAVLQSRQNKVLADGIGNPRSSLHLIDTCKLRFRTLAEAEKLAAFIAGCFPSPEQVLVGLGELLINAIEHGNLGIGYEKKSELVAAGTWRAEVERRQSLPEHNGKAATAVVARKPDGIYVVIEDAGNGFDWRRYMQIDLSRAGDNHGRGIALANNISFDKLTYNDKGNQAVAFVSNVERLEW